jgi:integrase
MNLPQRASRPEQELSLRQDLAYLVPVFIQGRENRLPIEIPDGRAYLGVFHKARAAAFAPAGAASLLARRPYDLRHAAVSTWLNAGVPAPQVAQWAGHSVSVLLRVYAKCITGQQEDAKRRIEDATRPSGTTP